MNAESFITVMRCFDVLWMLAFGFFILYALRALLNRTRPSLSNPIPVTLSTELFAILGISALSLTLRALFWRSAITPPFAYEQVTPMEVAKYLALPDKLEFLQTLLSNTHIEYIQLSPILLPITALIQQIFGPEIHIPVLYGAFFGTLGVIGAWLLGREIFGPLFGLCFAALVCVSPLQLMWSRIGGYYISGGVHVLFLLWIAWIAGQRASAFRAAPAGLMTWCSFYFYYTARAGLALGPFAFALAILISRKSGGRKILACLFFCAAFGLAYVNFGNVDAKHTVWPMLLSYVGYSGEQVTGDWAASTLTTLEREIPRALSLYFAAYRSSMDWDSTVMGWGPERGGLCLLGISILGLFGGLSLIRERSKAFLWFALLGVGLALSVLGITSPRRLLLFDLGWLAFAAYALARLIESAQSGSRSDRKLLSLGLPFVAVTGAYSLLTLTTLTAKLPKNLADIPFGQGWTSDGFTCLECAALGSEWERDIREGNLVLMFDTDVPREIPGGFAGLPTYGFQAALAAGKPQAFQEFYGVLGNLKTEIFPETYFPAGTRYLDYLETVVKEVSPRSIVWQFAVPTRWERSLIERLGQRGGIVREYKTALAATNGIRVTTSADLDSLKSVLLEMTGSGEGQTEACLSVTEEAPIPAPFFPLQLAPYETEIGTQWAVAGNGRTQAGSLLVDTGLASGLWVKSERSDTTLRALTREGNEIFQKSGDSEAQIRSLSVFPHVGMGCARHLQDSWWVVNPLTGNINSTQASDWLPQGLWTGITSMPPNLLVLASAEQEIRVFNLDSKLEVLRFPAQVLPTRNIYLGECSFVVAGDNWFASLDNFSSLLHVYDSAGKQLGALRLDRYLSIDRLRASAIAARGSTLAFSTFPVGDIRALTIHPSSIPQCEMLTSEIQEKIYSHEDAPLITIGSISADSIDQPMGPPKPNRAFDNGNLVCAGKLYSSGIGVHAPSTLHFPLSKRFSKLSGSAGIPDALTPDLPTSVVFEIWGDGTRLWQSDLVTPYSSPRPFTIGVKSIEALELRVTDGQNGNSYDSGAWLDLRLED